jgi:hypothetical protein
MSEFSEDLNEQFKLVSEYENIEENKKKYKTFDDFLKGKRKELSLELEELRKKKIEKKGGDLLKRCAIIQKLNIIDECLHPKDIHNHFGKNEIIKVDKSFYYGM